MSVILRRSPGVANRSTSSSRVSERERYRYWKSGTRIQKVTTPILIQVGGDDALLPVNRALHDRLEKAGKRVRMEIYEHGYHDFVMGPQGQNRPDLKGGEQLLDITLQALESALRFVKNPAP